MLGRRCGTKFGRGHRAGCYETNARPPGNSYGPILIEPGNTSSEFEACSAHKENLARAFGDFRDVAIQAGRGVRAEYESLRRSRHPSHGCDYGAASKRGDSAPEQKTWCSKAAGRGTMLDLDQTGPYPFVTSSGVPAHRAGGACTGTGVPPHAPSNGVVGVARAYITRVGKRPVSHRSAGCHGRSDSRKGQRVAAT